MTKQTLLEVATQMPDSFNVDEVIERLLFIAGVEDGIQEITDGKGIPQEEIERMVEGWRK
jgi:hypothetical protein